MKCFEADNRVVNCLEPHPYHPLLVVSGIDNEIKIVSPQCRDACTNIVHFPDMDTVIANNDRMLQQSINTFTMPLGALLRILSINGRAHTQDCD